MIAGGDEGKLHLLDKSLLQIRSTYVGACLHAGIVVGDYVYVSVKNDSYKLQVFELSTFKLLHSYAIPFQVIKFIKASYCKQLYIICVLQNGALQMLNTTTNQIDSKLKLFIGKEYITDFIRSDREHQYFYTADNVFGLCEIKSTKNDNKFKLNLLKKYTYQEEGFITSVKRIASQKYLLTFFERTLQLILFDSKKRCFKTISKTKPHHVSEFCIQKKPNRAFNSNPFILLKNGKILSVFNQYTMEELQIYNSPYSISDFNFYTMVVDDSKEDKVIINSLINSDVVRQYSISYEQIGNLM
eukprot:403372800